MRTPRLNVVFGLVMPSAFVHRLQKQGQGRRCLSCAVEKGHGSRTQGGAPAAHHVSASFTAWSVVAWVSSLFTWWRTHGDTGQLPGQAIRPP